MMLGSTTKTVHQAGFLAWCFFLSVTAAIAAPYRSFQIDSSGVSDSALTSSRIMKWSGRLVTCDDDALALLGKDSIRKIDYSQMGDLLRKGTLFTPLSQGGLGQWDGIDILGFLPQEQVVSHNGMPIVSAAYAGYHPLLYAPVSAERIEIVAGSDAIGALPVLGLAGVNVQRAVYNTARPYTSMWYHQGGGDLVGGHVTFAQNVGAHTSFAANIRRTGARGVYQQTDFDAWNVHLQGRMSASSTQEWLLAYDLSTIDVDPWGGLKRDPYGTSDVVETLQPMFPTTRESMRRHDVSLMHAYSDMVDTSFRMASSAYVSSDAVRRADSLWSGWYAGLMSTIDMRMKSIQLHAGARLQQMVSASPILSNNGATAHAWAKATVQVMDQLHVVSSMRYDAGLYGGLGYGVAALLHTGYYKLRLDASWITSGTPLMNRGLYYAHLSLRRTPIELQAIAYYRTLSPTGSGRPGAIVSAGTNVGSIRVDGVVQAIGWADSAASATTLYTTVRLSYRYVTVSSSVEFGTSLGVISSGLLPQYDVYDRSYSSLPLVTTALQHSGVSLFAHVTVGTASIRASFDNLMGTRWYTVAYMPEIPRQFRLSVDWTFVD